MLAQTPLCLDACLNAIERSPLPAGRTLAHRINELFLVKYFDDLMLLAKLLLVFRVLLVRLARHNRCSRSTLSHRVNRLLFVRSSRGRLIRIVIVMYFDTLWQGHGIDFKSEDCQIQQC